MLVDMFIQTLHNKNCHLKLNLYYVGDGVFTRKFSKCIYFLRIFFLVAIDIAFIPNSEWNTIDVLLSVHVYI